VLQLPLQVACEPPSQVMWHASGASSQSTLQVEPPSHTTSQPPPSQLSAHLDAPSQSDVQLPPLHA
jgi:hypothetical protein